jgi:hypothetical protein
MYGVTVKMICAYARAPPFLILVLSGGERPASLSDRFKIGEIAPGTHWIGNWLSPKVGLGSIKNKIIFCPESKPDSSVVKPVAYLALFNSRGKICF